jgi:ABC-2 type transport system ATP-binding protein
MRLLTGYLAPDAGTVTVAGRRMDVDPEACKRLIGYLPESAPVHADMAVHAYLAYAAGLRGVRPSALRSELGRVADLCGLRGVMHQPIAELSRGFRQRVGLAHAFVGNPSVLVLDEPTAGLDPNQIVEIRTMIRQAGADRTVLFSTHVLTEAEAICDRIVILHRGRIVADDTPAALRESLRGTRVLRIVLQGAAFAAVREALVAVRGVLRVTDATSADHPAMQVAVRVECREEAHGPLSKRLAAGPWTILEMVVERQSMEDVFRELTEHRTVEGRIDGR